MNNFIAFTSSDKPFGWMGNMCGKFKDEALTISFENEIYQSSETLFQCLRFSDSKIKSEIKRAKNGYAAKIVAKQHKDKMSIVPLSKQDVENMFLCVELKLKQHPILIEELLSSKDLEIYEDVSFRIGDTKSSSLFWGAAFIQNQHWIGFNVLGELYKWFRESIKGIKDLTEISSKDFTFLKENFILKYFKN